MTRQTYLDSMEKNLLHFWPAPKKEEEKDYQNWLDTIYGGVSWMDPFRFEQTLKELSVTAPKYRRDLRAATITAVYYRLADKLGWLRSQSSGRGATEDYVVSLRRMMVHLKPAGARHVLAEVDAGRVKYPDEILSDLVILAGKDGATP